MSTNHKTSWHDRVGYFGLFVCLPILIFFWMSGEDISTEEKTCANTENAKIGMWVMAQGFIEQKLRDPESAKFGRFSEANVAYLDYCKFRVKGSVRATNAFGAYVKTPYSLVIEYSPDDADYSAWGGLQ